MSHVAIRAEGLGKRYRLGAIQEKRGVKTLGERITETCASPFRRARRWRKAAETPAAGADQSIWALQDASFEIDYGQVVGLVGPNGAGKSTLLKILARITEPSHGHADVNGRIGSLLEVGTGFHQELTGRENIFLNGAILGMEKAEIVNKFDEIVAFAEVDRFLDTPVKRYSSGMYVRLAFAVAAHLEPEILLVDEVLAVGDSRFQKKCLAKMEDVASSGRTVIFVSHNMAAVTRICARAILLDGGRLVDDGEAHRVVTSYLSASHGTRAEKAWTDSASAPGGEVCRLRGVRIVAPDGTTTPSADIRRPVGVEIDFEVTRPGSILLPHFHLWNEDGVHVFSALDLDPDWRQRPRPRGRYVSIGWIPGNLLSEGMMLVDVVVQTLDPNRVEINAPTIVGFQVIDTVDGSGARGDYTGALRGAVRPRLEW
ncbi:MAG: ABC transporter ATP-binding protein, partial [Vicinamibacterales bacterium]